MKNLKIGLFSLTILASLILMSMETSETKYDSHIKRVSELKKVELTSIQSGRERVFSSMDTIFKYANEGISNEEVLKKCLSDVLIRYSFNENFDYMSLAYDPTVIPDIAYMSDTIEDMLEEQRAYISGVDDLVSIMSDYIIFDDLFVNFDPYLDKKVGGKLELGGRPHNYEALINNRTFLNTLSQQQLYLSKNIEDGYRVLIQLNEMSK